MLVGCTPVNTANYSATAKTTYVWRVEYDNGSDRTPGRLEDFGTTSLITYNGVKPDGAVTGPDEKGLFWPKLPPKPNVDEIEKRNTAYNEEPKSPLLHKNVTYKVTYDREGQNVTVPTNYDVYRTIVKNAKTQTPLKFTLGVDDNRVEKAVPISN
ncbi:hypothetical protein IQ266_08625 [filamentous cyanobacterium LEGE 11480]|uniref:Uncharacterized protein n=2 Tax=Romeriopsis TaxID=2992131 RepID=A0A928VK31_9CYAN|nr:hypothetical protein [Romeriopsis navalis LEGE 11480]